MTELSFGVASRTIIQRRFDRAISALEEGFGPCVTLDRLQHEATKQNGSNFVTADFRHALNQFALWADDAYLVTIARLLAEQREAT